MNDRLIPDEDIQSSKLVIKILEGFLHQLSINGKISNFKAVNEVLQIVNDALYKKKTHLA